jgi:glycosyltransferase involved in cell wall biosynthesis
VHIDNPTFGSVFSGGTHYLFSLLSGWKDKDISLDLYGTKIKPLNLNSGDRMYIVPTGSLWSNPKRESRWDRICWSFDLLKMLIVRRHEYDIVHFHALNWGSFLCPLILHPLGKKVIFTLSLYGNDNPSYIRKQPRGRFQVYLLGKFDGAIGLSNALVEDACKHGINNVICLPNFITIPCLEDPIVEETRASARAKLGISQESQVLLFVGSMIERKGVDILIDSFVILSKQYSDLRLVVVGPKSKGDTTKIDETYVSQQKGKIQRAGLERQVIWAGLIREQTLLVDYYHAADLFVFPTRNEGSPNVIVEAMAAGLPVIATRLVGITDQIVSDGESGLLLEVNQTDQFVRAIDQILRNGPNRLAMGAIGRKIALEKFGFEAYCQKLKGFYISLFKE